MRLMLKVDEAKNPNVLRCEKNNSGRWKENEEERKKERGRRINKYIFFENNITSSVWRGSFRNFHPLNSVGVYNMETKKPFMYCTPVSYVTYTSCVITICWGVKCVHSFFFDTHHSAAFQYC